MVCATKVTKGQSMMQHTLRVPLGDSSYTDTAFYAVRVFLIACLCYGIESAVRDEALVRLLQLRLEPALRIDLLPMHRRQAAPHEP